MVSRAFVVRGAVSFMIAGALFSKDSKVFTNEFHVKLGAQISKRAATFGVKVESPLHVPVTSQSLSSLSTVGVKVESPLHVPITSQSLSSLSTGLLLKVMAFIGSLVYIFQRKAPSWPLAMNDVTIMPVSNYAMLGAEGKSSGKKTTSQAKRQRKTKPLMEKMLSRQQDKPLTKEMEQLREDKNLLAEKEKELRHKREGLVKDKDLWREKVRRSIQDKRLLREEEWGLIENNRPLREKMLMLIEEKKLLCQKRQLLLRETDQENKNKMVLSEKEKVLDEREQELSKEEQKLRKEEQELHKEKQKLCKERQKLLEEEQKLREEEQELRKKENELSEEKEELEELKKLLMEKEKAMSGPILRITRFDGSPCRSNLRPLPGKQPFLANDWLNTTCELILGQLAETERVAPMSLSRHSRGGKTRALLEIAHKLFDEGVPAIYISFNDSMLYSLFEARQVQPLVSLQTRIAWVCTKKRPLSNLYSTNGLKCRVDEDVLQEWLNSIPQCVLLIDEINNLVDGGLLQKEESKVTRADANKIQQFRKVAVFLIENFCDKPGRYLVFSSHIGSTGEALVQYYSSSSPFPGVKQVSLPNMKTMKMSPQERKEYRRDFGFALSAYCGYSPGLLMTYRDSFDQLSTIFDRMNSKFSEENYTGWVQEFLDCLFEGGERNLTEPWDEFTSVEVLPGTVLAEQSQIGTQKTGKSQSKGYAIWSPLMLVNALNVLGLSGDPVFCIVSRILRDIPSSGEDDEDAWVLICCAVLALRCLNQFYGNQNMIPPHLLPPLPKHFNFSIERFVSTGTLENTLNYFSLKMKESSCPFVQLVILLPDQFPVFDAILLVWDGLHSYRWGYQMKQRRPGKLSDADEIDAAVMLHGEPKSRRKRLPNVSMEGNVNDGQIPWVKLTSTELNSFFGLSLQFATPVDWLPWKS